MAVTFTRTTQGSYDPETDSATLSTTTVVGTAVRGAGNPKRYQALGLVESDAPTLIFVPTTYGQFPEPGDTVVWPPTGGSTYTVRDVENISPDGVSILSRVIVEK